MRMTADLPFIDGVLDAAMCAEDEGNG